MVRMQRLSLIFCVALIEVMFILAMVPGLAWAWPVQSEPEVLLGFEEAYQADGRQITHHGVDLAASAGEEVTSPVDGEVSFVGAIPASDTSEGLTMRGVSVTMSDGRTVTLMPLSDISVGVGQEISMGTTLGCVAPSGDWSSGTTHLHIGYKEGRTYFDPMGLLGYPVPAGEGSQAQSEHDLVLAQGGEESFSAETAYAEDLVGASECATGESPAEAWDSSVVGNAETLPETAAVWSGEVTSGGAVLDDDALPGTAELGWAARTWSAIVSWFSTIANRVAALFADMGVAIGGIAAGVVVTASLFTVAMVFVAFAIIMFMRRRKAAVADVFGRAKVAYECLLSGKRSPARSLRPLTERLLCRGWGSCILQKLFPAPGEAFNVPGAVQSGGGDK